MLSEDHQMFLMEVLIGRNTKKKQTTYKSIAFYRAISYLKRNDLIKSKRERDKDNRVFLENTYYLTIKGNILARTLAGLTSTPAEFKSKAIT